MDWIGAAGCIVSLPLGAVLAIPEPAGDIGDHAASHHPGGEKTPGGPGPRVADGVDWSKNG